MTIRLVEEERSVRTQGLWARGLREVVAAVPDADLIPDAMDLLEVIVAYVTTDGVEIKPEETMSYGYWLVQFHVAEDHFELREYDATGTTFEPGVGLTLNHWHEQHSICAGLGAEFTPPGAGRFAVVSAGVMEGDPVQGARYPSPEHMSGWWITSDRFDGDVKTLRSEHLYHVTAARPELAKYLALPEGFCFDTSPGPEAWFDESVALDE